MNGLSESYELAQHLHNSLLGRNPDIPECEIADSGVRQKSSSDSVHPPEIYMAGEDRTGNTIHQTLSLGQTGIYYFRTINARGGIEKRLRISRYSDYRKKMILMDSLFMRTLTEIASRKVEQAV